MKYIDFHTHIFPDRIAGPAGRKLAETAKVEPCTDFTLTGTKAKMLDAGINSFVCLNTVTSPGHEKTINSAAASVTSENAGRIVSLGSVHPDSPDSLARLEDIAASGLPGIKLHPDYQCFFIDDEKLYPIYEKCADLGLFAIFHTGWDPVSPNVVHAVPEASARVAKAFPKFKMILAHLGGMRMWEQVYSDIPALPNLYLDTAMCSRFKLDRELAVKIILKHAPENVLLGSDCPWDEPINAVKYIDSLKISDDRKEKIFYTNALSLVKSFTI